ncbi:MAG: hypothetical protein ACOYD6_01335 [Limnochordia bacterium]
MVWILYYVPEGFLMYYTGNRFLGTGRGMVALSIAGLCYGSIVLVARVLLPGGGHILPCLIGFFLIARFLLRISWRNSLLILVIPWGLLLMGELLLLVPLMHILQHSAADILTSPLRHILFGYVGLSFVILAAILTTILYKEQPIEI